MDHSPDLLDAVVCELQRRRGDLREIASKAQMSYDTIHRIKNRENDPGYSKVKSLAQTLGIDVRVSAADLREAA